MPVLMQVVRTLMQFPAGAGRRRPELHDRLGGVLADPDPATIGARAAAAFADREPAWRLAAFQSVDVQIAARGEAALAAGDFLAVVGDVHVGHNPLIQGVFAHRHPDPPGSSPLCRGRRPVAAVPPSAVGRRGWFVESRGMRRDAPTTLSTSPSCPTTRAQGGRRTWLPDELSCRGPGPGRRRLR